MKLVLFTHSLLSDWNHGNAHFLRGVVTELRARGCEVVAWEPVDAWSAVNLVAERGALPLDELDAAYPLLGVGDGGIVRYDPARIDLDAALAGADVVLVHEWSDPLLVARIGRARAAGARFVLLFHDTHHRSVTAPDEMERYDLSAYDGVLAFGQAVAERYVRRGWARRVFVWHEAADVRVFRPLPHPEERKDLCWIGNWGDDERVLELQEFVLRPVRALGIGATVHGVRYPQSALRALAAAGADYRGWVANYRVPEVFAAHRLTVHVPRAPYAEALPGIPTIRPFEALACGIPLVSAPWRDVEGLFTPGEDYLVARDGVAMARHVRDLLADPDLAAAVSASGLATVRARHTCGHRVAELFDIVRRIAGPGQEVG